MSKLTLGAKNVVKLLNLQPSERMVIVTDRAREHIGQEILMAAEEITRQTLLLVIEDFGSRPLNELPAPLATQIKAFKPQVSAYVATGKRGELPTFRGPLTELLTQGLGCRHAHMINIDDQLMVEGMRSDYELIKKITQRVYEQVQSAAQIKVTSPSGTDLVGTFDPGKLRWQKCDGFIIEAGTWSNLPDGEVFTCPVSVDGILVGEELGEYFCEEYGVIEPPLKMTIQKGRLVEVSGKDQTLISKLKDYVGQYENGDRVGEFAIGTNIGLKKLSGNLLQDEKFPGVHLAFGNPFPVKTGASWDCPSHVDALTTQTTIAVDGQLIMDQGQFTEAILK